MVKVHSQNRVTKSRRSLKLARKKNDGQARENDEREKAVVAG